MGSRGVAAAFAGRISLAASAASAERQLATSAASSTQIILPNGTALPIEAGNVSLYMPAEWAPHSGCWLAWPRRYDVWRDRARPAKRAFTEVINAIARFEPVTVVAHRQEWQEARSALPAHVRVLEVTVDDSWLRDTGPTFVFADVKACPRPPLRALAGVDWRFNGWGDLYGSYEADKLVASKVCEAERVPIVDVDAVLEGGSIHVDGEGTLLTTEECLLNPNRNPGLSKAEIEAVLCRHLGVTKVIWLPKGLYGDHDTNGHVDNFANFAAPGVVLLAWTDDAADPQHAISVEAEALLREERDAKGRALKVIRLPCPEPMFRTQEEWESLDEEGRKHRHVGERLAASYANFYIANGAVIMPAFGQPAHDAAAAAVLAAAFPGREVVAVQTREIVLGGGNIHCITQQQPELQPL